MNARGRYVAPGQAIDPHGVVHGDPPETTALSFWVSGLASPFVTFGDRVKVYVEAVMMGDDAMIQTAVNAGFGELYAPGGRDLKEWQQVAQRRLPHKFGEVPEDVVKLSAAVDVQKTGLYYSITGMGRARHVVANRKRRTCRATPTNRKCGAILPTCCCRPTATCTFRWR